MAKSASIISARGSGRRFWAYRAQDAARHPAATIRKRCGRNDPLGRGTGPPLRAARAKALRVRPRHDPQQHRRRHVAPADDPQRARWPNRRRCRCDVASSARHDLATGARAARAYRVPGTVGGGTLVVGGVGGTASQFGLQSDNVVSMDVVTGTGREVTRSPNSNADLSDAVRVGLGQVAVHAIRLWSPPDK